jgi:hypothetical protein
MRSNPVNRARREAMMMTACPAVLAASGFAQGIGHRGLSRAAARLGQRAQSEGEPRLPLSIQSPRKYNSRRISYARGVEIKSIHRNPSSSLMTWKTTEFIAVFYALSNIYGVNKRFSIGLNSLAS